MAEKYRVLGKTKTSTWVQAFGIPQKENAEKYANEMRLKEPINVFTKEPIEYIVEIGNAPFNWNVQTGRWIR